MREVASHRRRSGNATRFRLAVLGLLVAVLALAWWSACRVREGRVVVRSEPQGIMGTRCSLVAVLSGGDRRGTAILASAEAELRRLEVLFSTWIEASEISRFHRALAGHEVPVSREVVDLLGLARRLHQETSGAFDITAGPLIDGWRRAAKEGRLLKRDELDALRAASRWQDLEITGGGVIKARQTTRLDVDGVAKGYAIDLAIAALREAGAVGGMVEVGGDLRVFGEAPRDGGWPVAILDPFADQPLGSIELDDRAVCTSGGYARFVEIDGRRYSHIIDPRSGQPADEAVSATVVAQDTATADAWATAMSVLGPAGLADLPGGVEALLLVEDGEERRRVSTPGFPALTEEADVGIRRIY